VLEFVTTVKVEVTDPFAAGVTTDGFQPVPDATYPVGRFNAAGVTLALKPFLLCTVRVKLADCPLVIVRLLAFADTVKLGAAVPAPVTVREAPAPPVKLTVWL
jgi:hypothetical protein